jgi:peptidoglycan/LPS O-acetylase OafA/YrhL
MSRHFAALRGFAIFLVVLNHSIVLPLERMASAGIAAPEGAGRIVLIALQSLGLMAVPTFLFLSGGFIVFAVRSKPLRTAYHTLTLSLRYILVPYLIWSLLFYVLIFALDGTRFSLLGYVKNLLVGYPLNFIPILVFFYLLSPFIVRIAQKFPWQLLLAIVLYQGLSLIVLQPGIFGVSLPAWTRLLTIPGLRLSIALWGIFFPLGIVYALYNDWIRTHFTRFWPILVVLWVAIFSLVVMHAAGVVVAPLPGVVLPIITVLIYPFMSREHIPLVQAWEWLGRRAYALYLSNLIWISLLLVVVENFTQTLLRNLFLLIPVLMLATLAIVALLMAGFEKSPVRAMRRYVFG